MPKPERNLLQIRLEAIFQKMEEKATKLTEMKNYEDSPKRFQEFITYIQESVIKAREDITQFFAVPPPPTWDECLKWVIMKETGTYLVLYRGEDIVKRLIVDETEEYETLTVQYVEREVQATLKKRLALVTLPDKSVLEKPIPAGIDGYKLLTVGRTGKKQREPEEGTVKVLEPELLPAKPKKAKAEK